MKKKYIEPVTDVVMVRLVGSLLDGIGVHGGSVEANPNDSFAKENDDVVVDDDDDMPVHTTWDTED